MSAWTWGVVCDNEHGAARELTPAEVQLHSAAPELADALKEFMAVHIEDCECGWCTAARTALRSAGRQP